MTETKPQATTEDAVQDQVPDVAADASMEITPEQLKKALEEDDDEDSVKIKGPDDVVPIAGAGTDGSDGGVEESKTATGDNDADASHGAVDENESATDDDDDDDDDDHDHEADHSGVSDELNDAIVFFIRDGDERALIRQLCSQELGQKHLFEGWVKAKKEKQDAKSVRRLSRQLKKLDESYPGGLKEYILKAKKLLEASQTGENPLKDWTPSVPQGEAFELGTKEYLRTEKTGIKQLGHCGFVLVAGGLGERLGYSGAKIGLPTEITTGTTYLQYYCEYIRAVQKKCAGNRLLPLCIMVSNDTKKGTEELLQKYKCFGLKAKQITLVEQGEGVPALVDNNAHFALLPDDPYRVVTKPHGHGDIHSLLHKSGVTKKWESKHDIKWIIMFQDTNGLSFHSLPLMLGVSVKKEFIMNSLAIPRKAKQAIGGIAKLTNSATNEERTINVEYNQLDPMLRGTEEFKDGDTNDEKTGYSPFPGNINQLLFRLKEYNEVLDRTAGIMPDFVNPKYKDETKTVFKKPTRLECMMQDFPIVLEPSQAKKVGFTQLPAELCFSPVKNSVEDGRKLQEKGVHPGCAASGEADQYEAQRQFLRAVGCHVEEGEIVEYNGIKVKSGPAIVLKPDFACCPGEYKIKLPTPENVKISARSTLVVRGPGVFIESLDLDGTLIVDVDRGEEAVIRDLVVKNEGWQFVPVETSDDEVTRMRGYAIERKDAKTVSVNAKPLSDAQSTIEQKESEWIIETEESPACTIL